MKIDIDDVPLSFGKYKGTTPNEIAGTDPSYVVWMHDTIKPRVCSKDLAIACEQEERDYDSEKECDQHYSLNGF